MLFKVNALDSFKLHCIDGEIGKIKEFLFDDRYWTTRYLVADTGTWLTDRQVLISPYALVSVNMEKRFISVNLSKKQIENCPPLNSDQPVSRQYEETYNGYFGWPEYWRGADVWGSYPYIVREPEKWDKAGRGGKDWNPDLRSTHQVSGYHIQAEDGEIGHVEDFIIDDDSWTIRY
ncbi:MAG: PRC-barrel domain-containing protein, partial [Candidatus Wallbacteria bacterium]|nr:PRC-barrel domain-containing protein [Candidatus Wallbacteria bacterium]